MSSAAPSNPAAASLHASSTRHHDRRRHVAVLYSGRFYGALTPASWVQDHLDHLIVPNRAAVFVVVDPLNVCDTALEPKKNASVAENSLALHRAATQVL